MIHINLLPYRETERQLRRRQFAWMAGLLSLLGVLVVWGVHAVLASGLAYQDKRNRFLQAELVKLERQLTEIQAIREKTQALLARRRVVESLQANRVLVVQLLDQIARQMPEGVYLKSLRQSKQQLHLGGYAQSHVWVSRLMRSLEASPWFESPLLIEIRAVTVNGARLNEFDLSVRLVERPDRAAQQDAIDRYAESGRDQL
ncbi:PilN domain-containing protein [Nitrosomonas halophila]|uniref:Type IV pilus assembly protein PilN n=1 Tax=Nitrosomonas halophila TaxID=44576 RepID=A0A1H3DU88_9PROT|nr:PilN domain-containing protein [Nitrosomonas halophila]SDX69976.1 type IV pilus assembly protein PilN [Nitrosomonas halophila]